MSQSLERALELLRRCAREPLTLADAAALIGAHKSTALRLLQILQTSGFVRRTSAGTYTVGEELTSLLRPSADFVALRRAADPVLRQLRASTGLTVGLAEYTGDDVVCVAEHGPCAPVGHRPGHALALAHEAGGRVVLAYLDRPSRDRLLAHLELAAWGDSRTAARDALEVELARIRSAGWAGGRPDRGSDGAIAAPIRNERGMVIASISLWGDESATEAVHRHVPALIRGAVAISRVLAMDSRAPTPLHIGQR